MQSNNQSYINIWLSQNPVVGSITVPPGSPTTEAAVVTDAMTTTQDPAVGPTTVEPGSPSTKAVIVTDTMTTPYQSMQSSFARGTTYVTQITKSRYKIF